jgi:hypothetical protein
VITALFGTVAGLGLLLYYSIRHWFGPWTPASLFPGAVLLPVVVFQTVWAILRDDTDRSVLSIVRPALIPVAVVGLLGQGATVAWAWPILRTRALERAHRYQWSIDYGKALRDPASNIVTDTCIRIFEHDLSVAETRLLGLLDRHPELAWTCLTSTISKERSQKFVEIALDRWYRELMHESAGETRGRTCNIARYMARFPGRKQQAVPALVSCALSAPTERANVCCSKSLTSTGLVGGELVDALSETPFERMGSLRSTLVRAAFHQFHMTSAQKQQAETLKITGASMRQFVLKSSCVHLLMGRGDGNLTAELTATLEEATCVRGLSSVRRHGEAWKGVCTRWTELESGPPRRRLCRAVRRELGETAVRLASDRVHAAIGGTERDEFASGIARGSKLEDMESKSMRELRERIEASRQKGKREQYRSIQENLETIEKRYDEDESFRRKLDRGGEHDFETSFETFQEGAPEWASKGDEESESPEGPKTGSNGDRGKSEEASPSSESSESTREGSSETIRFD